METIPHHPVLVLLPGRIRPDRACIGVGVLVGGCIGGVKGGGVFQRDAYPSGTRR